MTTYKVWNGTSWVYIDSQNYDARYVLQSSKGSNSGVASLDSSGHIPSEQLPSSIVGAVSYKGTFDPTSGAPTPAAQGYYYVASGTGTISATTFATGDWLVYTDESAWDKLENSSAASVTWSNVSDKPASYTPDTHDNTSHSVEYITVGGVTYEALLANDDIGTGATQVAAGNHTHSGYQPLDGDLTSIAGVAGSAGLLRKTASNTWSLDTNTYLTELSTVGNATNWDTASRPTFTGNALKVLRLNATGDAFEFATVSGGSGSVDINGATQSNEFATGDAVIIYDSSEGENRKVMWADFFNNLNGEFISIHGATEETTIADNDEILIYDTSATANRRMTKANLVSGLGGGGGGITWNEVTGTSQTAAADNGYIANNSSLVTVTLPSTCAVGKIIRITGKGAGGWKLAQNSGQSIRIGTDETTEGTSGYIESGSPYDSIEVICVTTDTEFSTMQSTGVLGVV